MADVRVPAITFFLVTVHLFLSNAATPSPSPAPGPRYIIVDKFGGGDYTRIQDAIAAVPSNNSGPVDIWVKPGIYNERVIVPANKPFITLIGSIEEKQRVVITGKRGGSIKESATVSVLASDFVGQDLIIENTYGRGTQAVALRVTGDRVSFYGCRILSFQDTLFDEAGRHFYSDCLILGATDFICGNAASVFERCHVHSISPYGGAITAQQRTSLDEKTGFTFMDCNITGVKSAILGRPWGNYSRVIFAHTFMSEDGLLRRI
ncbi:putative pectinesterase 11 isoform X2 [Punica granatum]|uniref:pectinesterase n=1 Tax=Punica granatum TaxID=22663 RepID=A0A6P8EF92_PUNGR|nr:putative pectinesterase 11 isoform X2 [Punica granatum]